MKETEKRDKRYRKGGGVGRRVGRSGRMRCGMERGIDGGGGGWWGGGGGGVFFFFKQKTAYEIRNCDWSSDVCSSDLAKAERFNPAVGAQVLLDGVAQRAGAVAVDNIHGVLVAEHGVIQKAVHFSQGFQIGRASCRERV